MNQNLNPQADISENFNSVNKEILRESLNEIQNAFESISSYSVSCSFSVSSRSNSSSADSAEVQKISEKTKEITQMVANRLNNFMKMSQNCHDLNLFNERANSEFDSLVKSLNQSLIACEANETKETTIYVRKIIEEISALQKEFKGLQNRLIRAKSQIKDTENEEIGLKDHMKVIEQDVSKLVIESKENENRPCCQLF